MSPKRHLITFYTKGFAIDGIGCEDLRREEKMMESMVGTGVDVYKAYTYGEVKELCPDAVYNFGYFFPPNMLSGFMGFFRWKAWIIRDYLSKMDNDDILIYRDVNVSKYKQYQEGLNVIGNTAEWILSKLELPLFIPIERENCRVKNHVKRSAFMLMNIAFEDMKNLPLLYTPLIVMRKTEEICRIMDDWWENVNIPGIVEPVHEGDRHEDFKHHTCASAILNLLLRSKQLKGEIPYNQFHYYLENRVFTMSSVKEYYPLKERPDGKWKCINKFRHQELVPYYSEEMIYYRLGNLWVLRVLGASSFKWLGYELSQPGRYRVSFEILFKNYIPDGNINVGFKTHFPREKLHNLWLNDMIVDSWKHVELVVQKVIPKEELFILIFDGLVNPNEIHIRDFKIKRF